MVVSKVGILRVTCIIKNPSAVVLLISLGGFQSEQISCSMRSSNMQLYDPDLVTYLFYSSKPRALAQTSSYHLASPY